MFLARLKESKVRISFSAPWMPSQELVPLGFGFSILPHLLESDCGVPMIARRGCALAIAAGCAYKECQANSKSSSKPHQNTSVDILSLYRGRTQRTYLYAPKKSGRGSNSCRARG